MKAPNALILAGFATGLALAPLALGAQSTAGDTAPGNASPSGSNSMAMPRTEATALEAAVYNELRGMGINVPGLDRLSSPQLAGILLTLTSENQSNRDVAVTAIIANGNYAVPDLNAEQLDEMDDIRSVVEQALARAGWSADTTILDDGQVIALFHELAETGSVDPARIEELEATDS